MRSLTFPASTLPQKGKHTVKVTIGGGRTRLHTTPKPAVRVKLLTVVLGPLLVTLGLVELVIKRIGVLRGLFGMKALRG